MPTAIEQTFVAHAPAERRVRSWPRALAGATALWLLLSAVVLVATFPYWPRSGRGWALVVLAGPPLYLALSGVLELVIAPSVRRLSSARYSARWFAGMLALLGAGCAAVGLGAWWWLRVGG